MGVHIFAFWIICFSTLAVKSEIWHEEQRSLHTNIQKYSGNISASQATRITLNECISGCFVDENSSFVYHKTSMLCQCYTTQLDVDIDEPTVETSKLYGNYLHGYQSFDFGPFKKWHIFPEEKDCLSLYNRGFHDDGVYMIYPSVGNGVTAWCDMTGGGWTVIQRRQDGLEDFYRNWDEYVVGFGNKTGEYWLGLENIHKLTESPSSLHIEMETFGDVTPTSAYASYSSFKIGNISTNYVLHEDGFNGNCGDSFKYHNGEQFSTIDRDNDKAPINCAESFSGAWWYKFCHHSNLNGLYLSGNHTTFADGIEWLHCWGLNYSLKTTIMKIRRNLK